MSAEFYAEGEEKRAVTVQPALYRDQGGNFHMKVEPVLELSDRRLPATWPRDEVY